MLVLIVFGFLKPEFIIARGWLLLAWMFSFLFVAGGRFFLRRGLYLLRRAGYFVSPAVIVGANDEGISLARQLLGRRYSGLDIIGFVDKKLSPGKNVMEGLTVLGPVEALDDIIAEHQIEELILASSAISTHDKLLEIFQRYGVDSKVNVRMSSGLYEIITTGLTVKEFAYVPMVCVNKVRLTGWDRLVKQLFDYFVTFPILVIALPLLAIIGIVIKLDSPGPIIHRRRVMGVNGREFYAFKFRTMYVDGDKILARHPDLQDELAKNHKLKNDPRVTKFGRIIRKFSLDELPQLINVISGQMSLVGPRMISPREMKKYSQWGINLLTVKPGITGLWQVSGRSNISYEERVRLDMHYIRNWSIWLDLQLLWRTLPAVFLSQGAY
jgi:exopolysaccharide biosynthesis polyprenyl glycosylphosphotransferase